MKTKPKRHKASNTFKFQTFSERISSIDYDVFHKVKHPYQEDDEEITYYAQALTKWNTENFSPGYYELRKKLPSDVNTLPQLLVLKDDIMKILLDHLKSCDIESLQPALELIVAVAKDLRKEFFPYFNPGILQECIRLLDTREVEQIEWTFTCLAHLFKFLWANIVKNINVILPQLLPLLSSSKPSYINNFVAESFAFVARKVRDKLEFLLLSLKNVKKSRDELVGVSKLFFEVITGVSSQFHSCTEEFLSVILRQLNDRKSSSLLFEICENLISFVTSFVTSKTDIAPVWNTFMKITNEFHSKWQRDCSVHNSENVDFVFKLILKFINGREVLLSNPQELTDLAMNLVTNREIRKFKSLHETLIDVLCCILTANEISMKIRNTNEMIIKILGNIDDDQIAIRFVEKIIELNQYESIVFREFLKYVRGLNDDLIEFLTKIVYMKTNFSPDSGKTSLEFYTLGLRSVPCTFTEFLLNRILDKQISDENIHQVENSLHSIIVLSFSNVPAAKFAQKSEKFFANICTCIEATENVELKAKLLYSLLIFVQYRFKSDSVKDSSINKVIVLAAKYINSNNYLCSLRILDSLSESSAFECLNSDEGKIRLINNLSSPFHKVRLFSSHVLSKMNISPVFDQISEIEMIFPSIETYRDKLQRLQKFECNELFANITDKYIRLGVLKFLFGNMYINFLYMWEPTQKLIQSHLENDPNAWSVFAEELETVATNDLNFDQVMEDVQAEFKCKFLKEHFYQLNGVDDRPDFYNVRCLLSNVMTNISDHSRIDKNLVVDHFLKFYKSEYTASNNDYGAYCNVTLVKERVSDGDLVETGRKTGKNYNKLFLIYLKLVNNLTNQFQKKSKSDIFDIHFELLSNGNSDIQKYAVSFICRVKDMNSYKERLHLLTNDNTIKDQLRFIRSDLESDTIPEQDVPYLMKIVLKILFGKVRKKSAGNLREAMFEFLVNCKKDEIIFFFDMIFKEFSAVVKDPSDPVMNQYEEINLKKVISPSWVLNYLNHVTEIFKKCGSLLQDVALKYLLRVLLKCVSIVVSLQNQKSSVHPCYYNLISKMRVNAFEAIIYFLENFEYVWSKNEINALFKFFVDPWIEKITEECLQSPNPLMKLFVTFTQNPKFFPLLAKKSRNFTALDVLMKLLNNDKVYFNVKTSIVEIVERLLTLEDEIDEEEMREFMYHDDVHKNKKKNQRYGMTLLMPYVSEVLQYLQASLSKKYIKLNSVYMLILKRVSEFGLNEESSAVLLNLLLPILRSKVTSSGEDDVLTPLLDTIINLFKTFKNSERFKEYLLQIAYLLGVATTHSVRQNLCELVSYISEKTKKKFIDSELICGLNLDDKKWIGQPDYDGRLRTFKSINEARDNEKISVYTGVFIVYNCFYMIKNVKDIALRDHSGLCLKNLCPALCEKFSDDKKELNLFLNDILLPLIREGILSDDENYQHESIALLGFMARECSNVHFVFRDLHTLVDREDIETDFFENILHLQHFRRIKTLKRFTEIMSHQVRAPSPYTLTFLFPLVTKSLLSAKFSNEHGLIDAAIEALGIICRLSNWRYYEKLLKFYVMEMRKNVTLRKQAIRIVSVILDSFHFDISQADQTNCEKKSDKVENDDDIEPMEVDEEAKDIADEGHEERILPVVQRMTVLCRSDATRVYRSIKSFLIPSLNRIFLAYDDSEQYHKQSKKDKNNDKEEMAVLSIPIAFAAVKLMKKLPKAVLEEYISTIFLKLSTYLKSRLPSIRLIARETMQNVLIEVGPKYLPRLLSEMMSILTKGFQIHVLVSSCHAILEKISNLFVEGEIDACVDPILEICIVDLFGKLSEEKEVGKITSKTPEAKGNKSYHMLNILSENITQCHVLDIILPLKQILAINMSTKTVNKVRRCLQYVALGLVKNKFIDTNSILELAYGISNDCIPELAGENQNNKNKIEAKVPEKSDTFLIPEEPRKLKPELIKTCARTNAHVIIEFGLELLESALRQEQLKPKTYRERLDPFIPIIKDCLHSQYLKLRILSLKCLVKLFRKKLPSLNENIGDICDSIFEILGEYSSPAMTGENAELLMSAAKAALVLVHDLDHKIDNCQLRIMLFVAEDLLKNITHYGTGFSLIRAAIKRKFNIPEVHSLMKIISELSIRSYSEPIRTMAREVYFKYLMDYPHGKKLRQHMQFYVDQLKYDQLDGRKSALEMLRMLLKEIPMESLSNLGNLLHFALACRLDLEESAECKKMVADCLIEIINRVKGTKENDKMFDTVMIWINEPKISVRRLALQILGLYVSTLRSDFVQKLDQILPSIEKQFSTGAPKAIQLESEDSITETDHLIFQTLHLYKMILQNCPVILTDQKYVEHVDKIGVSCRIFLGHSHEWIRLEAAQILGIILKSIDTEHIVDAIAKKKKKRNGFLRDDKAREMFKSLCLDFCDQLAPGYDVMNLLVKEIRSNLLYLIDVLKHIDSVDPKKLSLLWLMRKLIRLVALEVAKAPQKYIVRTMVFQLFIAMAGKLNEATLSPLLSTILTPVVRELETNDERGATIRPLADKVRQFYREKIPSTVYDEVITKVQLKLNIKKTRRKVTRSQMAVTDPEKSASVKVKKQLKKKEQKKRRLEKLRKRKFKSGKRMKLVDVSGN